MRRRYTLDEARGVYVDREGNVCPAIVISSGLGLLTSFTFDPERTAVPLGDIGGGRSLRTTTNDDGDQRTTDARAPGENGEAEQDMLLLEDLADFGKLGHRQVDKRVLTAAIDEVWAHYVRVLKPREKTAGDEERKIIREALRVATVAECKRAIDACASSGFHMGENDKRRKYNSLSQILKAKPPRYTTRERIDFFLDLAASPARAGFDPTGDPARIAQAKQDVLDGLAFPGDALVVSKGEEAAAWLVQQGWQIDKDPETGQTRFRLAD